MGIVYCADVIARYRGKYVLIKRLAEGGSIALPGGKQDVSPDGVKELLSLTALRELYEETGLKGHIVGVLGMYADDGRDPRGQFISCVFIIEAHGNMRTEDGKSSPIVLSRLEIEAMSNDFAFDHADIYKEYFLTQQ